MAVDTSTVHVVMPAMGDSVSEGTVLEWHKQEGDTVAADETVVEISTDKVDAEVPAPVAGTVVLTRTGRERPLRTGALVPRRPSRARCVHRTSGCTLSSFFPIDIAERSHGRCGLPLGASAW